MRRRSLRTCCLLSVLLAAIPLFPKAQTYPAQTFIDTWKLNDTKQTHAAARLFDDLSQHKDSARYDQLIRQLDARLSNSKDPRLHARLVMYKALWTMETAAQHSPRWLPEVMTSIRDVYPLNDKQLNAELYALYGELSLRNQETETSLFYNLRSLELQEEIGATNFPKIGWMYLSVARSLYNTEEYEQAKQFALKCRQQISQYKQVSAYDRIFLYDILGATYNKTGKPDSAAWYFRQIASLIQQQDPRQPATEPAWSRFWLGLVDGYLGRLLLQKKEYRQARQLLQQAVTASLDFKELSDAAAFTNDLALLSFQQGRITEALTDWQKAWQWAGQSLDLQASMDAALGLSKVFMTINHPDSAFYYVDQYHIYRDTLASRLNKSKLNVINARIDYEKVQESLRDSQHIIYEQQKLRNFLITGGILIIIIIVLLYNRSRAKQQHKAQMSEERRLRAEQEAADAIDKLDLLRQHIIEKMELLQPPVSSFHPEVDLTTQVLLTEEDWTRFKAVFTKAYPRFFPAIRNAIPNITPSHERLAAIIYLRLDNAQAGACLGISPDSVARSKRRLRQTLGLSSDAALEEYIFRLT